MKGLPIRFLAISSVFLGCIGLIGYSFTRDQSVPLMALYGISFACFFWLYRIAQGENLALGYFFGLGLLARVLLVFSWPTLSDDFARFLWDGYLVLQGISPYAFTPDTLLAKEGIAEAPFLSALHPLLNSSGYYSIYPPVNQLFFALSVYVGQSDFFHALVFLRIVLIAAEGLVFFVMHKMLLSQGLSPKKTLLYALNPLVILEIAGNLHFEGLMLLAVLGTFWLFRRRSVWSGCCFGLAIAIKLTPLLLAPMLLAKSRSFSDLGKFTLGLFLMLVCCLLPIYPFQDNFFTSFSLYYGKFEFNASIYYLIREIFMFWIDYNPIQYVTPLLSIISATAILWLAIQSRIHLNIYQLSVLSYVCYLMLHAVVHPWYIILPLGLSVFTKLQTMQVWSAFIFLSYVAYRSVPVLESPWVILVQYVAVLFFFYRDIQNFNTAQTIP